MPYLPGFSYEKKRFYFLWQETGFDPKKRNDCMSKAGYATSTIKTYGKKFQREIHEIVSGEMDKQGMTLSKLVKVHKDQLGAMAPANPEMPDNHARLKALDMAYTIRDCYPTKKIDISKRSEIAINISLESLKAAEEVTGEPIIELIPEENWEHDEVKLLEQHPDDLL